MDVRIFWVRAMKCMCTQTRPQYILSSERVFGGMEFEPMLTPREKSPLPENVPRRGSNPRRCGQRAQTLPTRYSGPLFDTEWGRQGLRGRKRKTRGKKRLRKSVWILICVCVCCSLAFLECMNPYTTSLIVAESTVILHIHIMCLEVIYFH